MSSPIPPPAPDAWRRARALLAEHGTAALEICRRDMTLAYRTNDLALLARTEETCRAIIELAIAAGPAGTPNVNISRRDPMPARR